MEIKKLVIVLVICLFSIFLLFFVRSAMNGTNKTIKKVSEVKNRVQYKFSQEYINEQLLLKVVEDLEKALQEPDYRALFAMMDETFMDYKFGGDQTEFRHYLGKFVDKNVNLEIQEYEELDTKYICTLVMYKNQTASTFKVAIMKNNEGEPGKIVLDSILSLNSYQISAYSEPSGIKSTLIYAVTSNSAGICVVEIENTGDKALDYRYGDVIMRDSTRKEFIPEEASGDLHIDTGEKTRIQLTFPNKGFFANAKSTLDIKVYSKEDNKELGTITIFMNGVAI